MAVKNELKDFREEVAAYMAAGGNGNATVSFSLSPASSSVLGGIMVGIACCNWRKHTYID